MEKPVIDFVEVFSPAIAIEQRSALGKSKIDDRDYN